MAADKRLQDRGDGVKSMPYNWGTGRQGLVTADNGGRVEFQGDTAGMGALPVVR